ncbi:MAG: hypothetical protein CL600_00300 [Alteromonas sp.]|nr:hypothetical protein [Alteromonas sp.]
MTPRILSCQSSAVLKSDWTFAFERVPLLHSDWLFGFLPVEPSAEYKSEERITFGFIRSLITVL